MSSRKKSDVNHPTITEAVEKLSSIAEMDFDRNLTMATNELEEAVIPEEEGFEKPPRSVNWLYEQDPLSTVDMIKDMFQVILDHFRKFYKKEYRYIPSSNLIEGVKAIMILVGEAAKRIDQHKEIFQRSKIKSITDLPEYKRLQEFYLGRVARKIDEKMLGKWIMGLSHRLMKEGREFKVEVKIPPTKHLFVDLESVKKDTTYELFFIRKEDGTRFFSPRLIRNIKLVCDFGDRIGEMKDDDPLDSINVWRDHASQTAAHDILQEVTHLSERFANLSQEVKGWDLSISLNKAMMALMLCNNKHNVSHNPTIKTSSDYFTDFQTFLRKALHAREYQRLCAYPPSKTDKESNCLLDLAHGLCQALFLQLSWNQAVLPNILGLIQEGIQEAAGMHTKQHNSSNTILADQLNSEYQILNKLFKRHPNGPLMKVIEILENGDYQSYDPLMQINIPSKMFTLYSHTKKITFARIPCPIHQEYIDKLTVIDEFKGFLRSLHKDEMHSKLKFLLINFQDRNSWQEHSRSVALEELHKHSHSAHLITVVTIPKDTEFYYQEAPYHKDNHADSFIKHFKEQLKTEEGGFHFPENIKKALFPTFIDNLLKNIHQIFFGSRNILPLQRRLDFIEIFYLFLELKLIELVKPNALSMMCKDGIDVGMSAVAPVYIFCKWLQQEKLSKNDMEMLTQILFTPSIMIRERMMLPERFDRMQAMLRELQSVRDELGWRQFAEKIKSVFGPFTLHTKG